MDLERYTTINQTNPHHKTSDKYSFIPTSMVLDTLQDHGWFPSKVSEAGYRNPDKKGFQKHIVRLQNPTLNNALEISEDIPEIVVINSHMGSSSFRLMLGIYRMICANGLTVGDTFNEYRITHKGFTLDEVNQSATALIDDAPKVLTAIENFKSIALEPEEQRAYAESALEMRFDGDKYTVKPDHLLLPRRYSESKDQSLWGTFNRVQENVIRGGIPQYKKDGSRIRSRAVKSVDQDVKLNRALWSLTEKMAELKTMH